MKAEHLGGDRYRIRVGAGKDPLTGRYRQLSRHFTARTKAEAKERASKAESELRRQVKEQRAAVGTVGGLAQAWLATKRAEPRTSPATIYRAASIVATIVRDLGPVHVEHLSVRHVEQWYTTLRAENVSQRKGGEKFRSESTVHHYYRVLHAILRIAERQDGIPAVTGRARNPERMQPDPRPPATDTLDALITSADGGLRIAVEMAAMMGLRRGEILGARWTDLAGPRLVVERSACDVPGKPVTFKRPKSGHVRVIDVPDRVQALLLAWRGTLEAASGGLHPDAVLLPDLLADPSGRVPWRPSLLTGAWRRHCRALGAPGVRFHDLRHWAATVMLARGASVPEVARRMGHRQTSTTLNVYGGVMLGDRQLGELLAGELTERAAP